MQTGLLNNNGANAGSNAPASPVANGSATSDMFTKLLVAQIKNQDPLSPTDPSQFVNQLAQLSQTESLQNLSSLTSANASVLQSMQVLALGAQVGSEVTVSTSNVTLGTQAVSGAITLKNASSKTTLVLTGTDGQKHDIALGPQALGSLPFSINPVALGLPAGNYTMAVQTDSGETPAIDVAGKLNSVRLSSSGSVVLSVANVGEVSPAAVTGFNGYSGANASNLASH
ncbi:flagellar hook capping FlgD N-terminal domain-containing protein [Undibacterium sp.]|jgi:flagellar basal-body rod modification protein FlgD|uniref:flagellar hook capping FlgD N-terminal domain-containing protein n=1 Tax=Undibacterium sp. TaxID=1914977 RepID=UPI002BC5DB60|nr:flagellar hook capping FlgD N-terminal domain-containing protein [Undibacterium sp.]HTD04152.1 flagellar hook capping FlgD N-terminal domain-containing protein [Undibacterium sp.]